MSHPGPYGPYHPPGMDHLLNYRIPMYPPGSRERYVTQSVTYNSNTIGALQNVNSMLQNVNSMLHNVNLVLQNVNLVLQNVKFGVISLQT